MVAFKKKKLDLKIVPALIPSIIGASVTLVVLGKHIGIVITSLVDLIMVGLITFHQNSKSGLT